MAPESQFKFGETNKSADFLAKFPLGKVSTSIQFICDVDWTESEVISRSAPFNNIPP